MSDNVSKPHTEKRSNKWGNHSRGFSFLDIIVGSGLMLLVFVSLVGVLRMSIGVITESKIRVGAIALVQERLEYLHSLSYGRVGTVSGIPSGDVPQNEDVELNGITYHRHTLIQYVDDPSDYTESDPLPDKDTTPTDYKVVKVEVTWDIAGGEKSVAATTNIMPPGLETNVGGGTLIVHVFDALLAPIQGAEVHIVNTTGTSTIDTTILSNDEGKVITPGYPAGVGYEITVTKSGYTTAQTYEATWALPAPSPGHQVVIEGNTTELSLQIDELAEMIVRTWFPISEDTHTDDMNNTDDMQAFTHVSVVGGEMRLADSGAGYYLSGSVISEDIDPEYIAGWTEFSWTDTEPLGTSITYHIYDADTDTLIPEGVLPGNALGFTTSPVALSGIPHETYDALYVEGVFETSSTSTTPSLDAWSMVYDEGPIPVPDIGFDLIGTKTIGEDGSGQDVLLYHENHVTDSTGEVDISGLTWDTYTILIEGGVGTHAAESFCPPRPHKVDPGDTLAVDVYLTSASTNSLLAVLYALDGAPATGAEMTLSRAGFSETVETDECGNAYFGSLSTANDYTVSVNDALYGTATVTGVDVSGHSFLTVVIE